MPVHDQVSVAGERPVPIRRAGAVVFRDQSRQHIGDTYDCSITNRNIFQGTPEPNSIRFREADDMLIFPRDLLYLAKVRDHLSDYNPRKDEEALYEVLASALDKLEAVYKLWERLLLSSYDDNYVIVRHWAA